jgi:hypothetical protein
MDKAAAKQTAWKAWVDGCPEKGINLSGSGGEDTDILKLGCNVSS